MQQGGRVILLVGHGGVPRDFPRAMVRRLMQLEAERQASGVSASAEELALDREIRNFPRSEANDPYKFGLEKLAAALRPRLRDQVRVAYNEFCAPSVEHAVAEIHGEGAREVVIVSSMMTPGGSHSEEEIPALVRELQERYPALLIRYAWPYDMGMLADLVVAHLESKQLL